MKNKLYHLSNPQKSIWLTEQLTSNTSLNNVGGYVLINEPIDFDILDDAINFYIKANEAMRMHVTVNANGTPMQYVVPFTRHVFSKTVLNDVSDFEIFNQKLIKTPFSILDSDLFRFHLFSLPNGNGGFHITVHHLITDAWSMSLLVSEVMDNYAKLIHKEKVNYVAPNYTDFLATEKDYLASNKFLKDKEFWEKTFNQIPELCTLTDKKTVLYDTTAKREAFVLDTKIYDKINDFCQKCHSSIYTFWLTVYSIYLTKLNNTNTSIIGTPILNRTNFKDKHTSRYVY